MQEQLDPDFPSDLTGFEQAAAPTDAVGSVDRYRSQLVELKERLEALRQLQEECNQLETDGEQYATQRQELLAAIVHREAGGPPRTELEGSLQQLGVKQEICKAELDYFKEQLRNQEEQLQAHLIHTNSELEKLWRCWLTFVQPREFAKLEQLIHPEFRGQQRLLIEQLAMVSTGVIECRKQEPQLLSVAEPISMTLPLRNSPKFDPEQCGLWFKKPRGFF